MLDIESRLELDNLEGKQTTISLVWEEGGGIYLRLSTKTLCQRGKRESGKTGIECLSELGPSSATNIL